MPAGGLLTGALLSAGTLAYGAIKKNKEKKKQASLLANRPKYEIPQEEQDIQNLAESRANLGMGAGARQRLQNNADRQLATLSNAALMGGAGQNSIANIADRTANAYSQNAIYDDQVRLQNLNNLQSAWARQSANRDKQWSINTNQPWKDSMAANAQDIQYADNVMSQGISGFGSALGGIAKYGAANWGRQGAGAQGQPTGAPASSVNWYNDRTSPSNQMATDIGPVDPNRWGVDYSGMPAIPASEGMAPQGYGAVSGQYPIGGQMNISPVSSYWGG